MNPISTGSHVTIRYFVTIPIKHIFDELLTLYKYVNSRNLTDFAMNHILNIET